MKHLWLLLLFIAYTGAGYAQTLSGTWNGQLQAGPTSLPIVFHFDRDETGKDRCLMDSPDQSVQNIPTVLHHLSEDSVSLEIPALNVRYQARLQGNILKGTFTQRGIRLALDLKSGNLERRRPQHPTTPYPYLTQEVKFANPEADAVLAGTLTYPTGWKPGEKVPVVLMVTGSGGENRDEEIFGHKPFLVIADYLARHGIASLRYDDRKVGQSTGKSQAPNTLEVCKDAEKGIEFLRKSADFSQVGLIGHSEGGSVAFMLGARGLLDFAISMAGCGVKGNEALYAQFCRITELSGQQISYTQAQYDELVSRQANPWMKFFLSYDPTNDIRQTSCPILALNGGKDTQVIASQNLTAIEKLLPQNPKNCVRLYPNLNHLFQDCQTGLPTEYAGIEQTCSPEVLKDMAEWILSL